MRGGCEPAAAHSMTGCTRVRRAERFQRRAAVLRLRACLLGFDEGGGTGQLEPAVGPPVFPAGDIGAHRGGDERPGALVFALRHRAHQTDDRGGQPPSPDDAGPTLGEVLEGEAGVRDDARHGRPRRAQAPVEFEAERHDGQLRAGVRAVPAVALHHHRVVEVESAERVGDAAEVHDAPRVGRRESRQEVRDQREVPEVVRAELQLEAVGRRLRRREPTTPAFATRASTGPSAMIWSAATRTEARSARSVTTTWRSASGTVVRMLSTARFARASSRQARTTRTPIAANCSATK